MRFDAVIWRHQFLEKIIQKHQLYASEVEEVLRGKPTQTRTRLWILPPPPAARRA